MDSTDFILGGLASTAATVFTNPLEVVKTRMQLQGELAARGTHVEPYRNIVQAFLVVIKNDGLIGLQKGLAPSLCFQFMLNAWRLGIYNTAMEKGLTRTKSGRVSLLRSAFFGATGGFVGAALASPFFLLKTHLMSKAKADIAVGFQHDHSGMWSAFRSIYEKHGVRGLYRGVWVNMPRALFGSGGQLAAFGYTKDALERFEMTANDPKLISFISGAVAGTVMAVTMNPGDVIAIRLYNQGVDATGKGLYYNGVVDCFVKIVKTEGFRGLYKGFWPQYARIGPHATLVLFFFDQLKRFRQAGYGFRSINQ